MNKSRTEYSAKNTTISLISRLVAILMGFVTRVIFTRVLSEAYVGVNGLFLDILNVLSLSELGIGTAITFSLYKPIATENIEKQKSLMKLFRNLYTKVALFIFGAGLCVIPFLPYLVGENSGIANLTAIYLLYLLNSVVSYLFIYKKTIIDAHQLGYIGVLSHTICLVVQNVFQIFILLWTGNFFFYLIVYLVCTMANNIYISRKADRMYPYLKEKDTKTLEEEETREIKKNIRAMLMHKLGAVTINNTDNLLISVLVGIASVGVYSNYFLIIGSIRQLLDQVFQGITASVGNLGATSGKKRVKKIFEASFFVGQWIYGVSAICLFELLNLFVEISFTEKYVFSSEIVLVLCMNFYMLGMRQATTVFHDSLGLFWFDRYKSIIEAILNIGISIVLGLQFGVLGIFLGTFISSLLTSVWMEPYVLYKKHLKIAVWPYFVKYAFYALSMVGVFAITHFACSKVVGSLWVQLILRMVICATLPNGLLLIIHAPSKELRFLLQKAKSLFEKKALGLTTENIKLLDSLKCALHGEENGDLESIKLQLQNHVIVPFFYETNSNDSWVAAITRKTVLQNYHLFVLTHQIQQYLKANGIGSVVLKGVATASVYPIPEYRKSGDIDLLLLDHTQIDKAKEAMISYGFWVTEEQVAHHHLVMQNSLGIDVEIHVMLAEPFDNEKTNRYLEQLMKDGKHHTKQIEVMGLSYCVLSDGYHAFELLLHMLQHFLRSGFGLKLLCDWVYFWSQEISDEEIEIYNELVEGAEIEGFSDLVSSLCVYYLGMKQWQEELLPMDVSAFFMQEILEAEEFGKSSVNRMVVLRGNSLWDYVREFHHQMNLNFPKAGKWIPLWPVLWCYTLWKFLWNNKTVRKTSGTEILKTAAKRSKMMRYLHLFRR